MLCIALCACLPTSLKTQSDDKPEPAIQVDGKPPVMAPKGYNNAIKSSKAGNMDDAIKQFQSIIEKNPDFANAYTNLGLLYLQKGNKTEAEKHLRKAISINEKDAVAYNHLGVILRDQGKFSDAKDKYQKATQLKPDYADAVLNLGILYDLYLHELDNALTQYKLHQQMTSGENKTVDKWILDLEKRIASGKK